MIIITPLKAIRLKCRDCQNNSLKSVRCCKSNDCPLFFFRMGKNPNRSGIGHKDGVFKRKLPTQLVISQTKREQGENG